MLSARIGNALASYGDRIVVEAAGDRWRLTGEQLLGGAAWLLKTLEPYSDRPLIAYLHKSPLYYAFTACSFLNSLNFCPVDIDNPIQRVLDIAAELPNSLILCDNDEVFALLRKHTEHCLEIGLSFDDLKHGPANEQESRGSQDASYYIATSGSTGSPKLVQVPHAHTVPFLDWAIPFYEIDDSTRWAQFSSIGFDLSLVDFLTVVCGGGTLVSLSTQMDRIRPAKTVLWNRITHWHSVPSMIPYFLREPGEQNVTSTCRLFTFCGEPFMKTDADKLAGQYPNARIINTYGPTETTLFCSFFEYRRGDPEVTESSLPIGKPIPSWNFVLLPEDDALKLIILSDNVATGYAGLRSLKFTTVNLFGREVRAFDTGDYLKMAGPNLYFSHRKDMIVKINGNRIDLGEIEAAGKRSGLVNPVAMVIKNAITLVAEGAGGGIPEIMNDLSRYLPHASLPTTIQFVRAHPRTINGKVDRRAIHEALGHGSGS